MSDVRVWRVIINGFPYKTPTQLGVENEYDAFVATKHAVYSILYNRDVYSFYRGGDDRGTKIVNAIANMVNEGRYGTRTPQSANVTINKVGQLIEESNYYSQEFKVSAVVNVDSYIITSTVGLPNGAMITDMSNNSKNSFSGSEHFKVLIPKDKMNTDIQSIISAQTKCETYPIFYGLAPNSSVQNYALTFDPLGDETGVVEFNLKTNTGKIQINKTDDETNEPIAGVTFKLTKDDGTVVGSATTDENGVATFDKLYQANYKLVETQSNTNYILNSNEFDVNVEFNKTSVMNIENEHKKGNIKVYKVDKDNKKVVLGNVEFQLYSHEFGRIVGTYNTDVDGELYIENIRTGNYSLIETKTNKWYNLAEDVELEVEWELTTELQIENELKKGSIKIIKIDHENNEVKLENVKFNIMDSNGNVLEELTTDENGEAVTQKYPVRDFEKLKIQEVETLDNYVLDNEVHTITLEENQITDFIFENQKIKGQVQIVKVSKDDNKLTGEKAGTPLEGATFEIYNENNELVDTIVTDEEGKAISDLLVKGKYTVKEVDSGSPYYLVNSEVFNAEIIEHKQIVDVIVEEESVDIDVKIEKTGFVETQSEDEIYYDFKNIKNSSNVYLDTFNWRDSLPTNALRLEKIFTGTWNQDLTYSVWYRSNINDYKMIRENLNTNTNYEIDFTDIELQDGEYITDYEFRFGKVDIGFMEVETPRIYCRVLQNLSNGFKFTNTTKVYGTYFEKYVEDKDNWSTVVYDKDIQLTKLPRTGC